jgi:SAM-dependent methyltransferase
VGAGRGSAALDRWREQLEAWRIPSPILEAAPEPPWGFPRELFRARAARSVAGARRRSTGRGEDATPTVRRAGEALPPAGSVLDVGCGGGATSLPLAGRMGSVTGVDAQSDMLESFLEAAAAAGVTARTVPGPWPDVADRADPADVVVCGHVLYNVADAAPFVAELTAHARHRVVLEITDRHPLAWTADLWQRFHGLDRPTGPTADDAMAAVRQAGPEPRREDRDAADVPSGGGFARREDAIALVRRRLCLPATRDPEVEAALGDRLGVRDGLWSAGPTSGRVVTLWWDVGARSVRTGSGDQHE